MSGDVSVISTPGDDIDTCVSGDESVTRVYGDDIVTGIPGDEVSAAPLEQTIMA